MLLALPTQAVSHEFWLEPKKFQARSGEEVQIDIRNGENFRGLELSWFDPRITGAKVKSDGNSQDYQGLPGDLPAMTVPMGDGLTVVSYSSTMTKLTYDGWAKVVSFADHKDFPWLEARHAERGLSQEGVTEGYWRFSKTLITGTEPLGQDEDTGMPTEFVALTNPAAPDIQSFRARLIYDGAPRTDAQVELWEKRERQVTRTLHRTDQEGIVTVPVRPGYEYMIDAVVLREPTSSEAIEAGVMWESLWANMTFAVPE